MNKQFYDVRNVTLVHSFSLKTGEKYHPLVNVATSTQKLNDLTKVIPGEQGLEAIYSFYINLNPKEV